MRSNRTRGHVGRPQKCASVLGGRGLEGLRRLGTRPQPPRRRPMRRERTLARSRASGSARPAGVEPRACASALRALPLRMVTLTRVRGRGCCTAADNSVGDDGAQYLAAALGKNKTVTSVDLGGARACASGSARPSSVGLRAPLRALLLIGDADFGSGSRVLHRRRHWHRR